MGSEDDNDNGFGVSRKIMLVAISSLSAVVVIIVFLHFYSRCMSRRQERRELASPYWPSTQVAVVEGHSSEPPGKGLDPSVIASLPKFIFKPTEQLDHCEVTECSICLSTIVEEATVRLLPNCKHTFHAECIDMWFNSNTTCPICRTAAEPRVQPEHEGSSTGVQPTAPPLDSIPHGAAELEKAGGSGSRLNSFRRMLSRERSSRRIQSCGDEVGSGDLERQ